MYKVYLFKSRLYGGQVIPLWVDTTKNYQNNNRIAIQLNEFPTMEEFMTATVNLPDVHLKPDEVLIKNWSENEGVLEFLQQNNIVGPTITKVPSGWVEADLCKLLPVDQWKPSLPQEELDKLVNTTYGEKEKPETDNVTETSNT